MFSSRSALRAIWRSLLSGLVATTAIAGQHICWSASPADVSPSLPAIAASAGAPYCIAPGDQLQISVLNHADLSATVTVLPDGTFDYPIAGTVHAGGETLLQVELDLQRSLSVQLNQPQVTVTVASQQVQQVSVLGAVKTPGKIDYKDGWRVLDAIAACGGLSVEGPQYASASLIRGGTAVIPLDLEGIMGATPSSTQNVPLQPGDVILVSTRQPSQVEVDVLGEVNRPGFEPVPADGSINTVLVEAGGPTQSALLSKAQIDRNGTSIPIDLRSFATQGRVSSGMTIQPGDTLVIPQNRAQYAVFGAVATPGFRVFPDDRRPLTLLKALGSNGAPTPDANLSSVTVVRPAVQADQKATVMNVDVAAILKNGDTSKDVVLRPGDIVYVQNSKHHMSIGEVLASLNPLLYLSSLARL